MFWLRNKKIKFSLRFLTKVLILSNILPGFDMLFETLFGRNKLSLMQLYALYQQSKSQGQGEAGSLYDKFQKDLIAKVMQILEEVNHPKFPEFEVGIDLKLFGRYL